MKNFSKIVFTLLMFCVISIAHVFSQDCTVISKLESRNPEFKQHQAEFQKNNMAVSSQRSYEMNFYKYTVSEDFDVISLSSRTSLRQDTVATLNGIESSNKKITGTTIYLPTINGLFIPLKPVTSIDFLLKNEYPLENENGERQYPVYTVGGKDFYFIVDGKFSSSERAFFLTPELRLPIEKSVLNKSGLNTPLDKSVLTSEFGMRTSPISGKRLMHKGIDMAAPMGTPIHAAQDGTVITKVAMDNVYGNYIILDHGKGMTSLYGHMSKILVSKGDRVSAGETIGLVGSTGMSTGPHLHFEIKLNGELQDPQKYINVK